MLDALLIAQFAYKSTETLPSIVPLNFSDDVNVYYNPRAKTRIGYNLPPNV